MNKKVLIITEKYYPQTGANTVCCENVAEYLKNQGYSVDILAIKQSFDEEVKDINGIRVKKLDTFREVYARKYAKKYNVKTWEELPKFIRLYSDFINKIKYFFSVQTQRRYLDTLNYKKIYKEIKRDWGTYDCIISTCAPFSLVVMGKKLRDMGLAKKWITILLDTYVHDAFLGYNPKRLAKRKALAEKILDGVDGIFALEGVLEGNLQNGYNPEYHKKLVGIYPITLKEQKNYPSESDKIEMIYTGRFYNKIREPEKMLKILSCFPSEFKLNLYSTGCDEEVERLTKTSACQMEICGQIGHEEVLEQTGKSDILINLGNTIANQMPSKVLEYMGFGKPIVNFYQNPDDMGIKMFNAYPLAFNFNLNDYTEGDIERLIAFCKTNAKKVLSYQDATKDLTEYKVETICQKIYDKIEEN